MLLWTTTARWITSRAALALWSITVPFLSWACVQDSARLSVGADLPDPNEQAQVGQALTATDDATASDCPWDICAWPPSTPAAAPVSTGPAGGTEYAIRFVMQGSGFMDAVALGIRRAGAVSGALLLELWPADAYPSGPPTRRIGVGRVAAEQVPTTTPTQRRIRLSTLGPPAALVEGQAYILRILAEPVWDSSTKRMKAPSSAFELFAGPGSAAVTTTCPSRASTITRAGTCATVGQAAADLAFLPFLTATPSPACGDGLRNGGETDVDCGGTDCAPCPQAKRCATSGDCAAGACWPVFAGAVDNAACASEICTCGRKRALGASCTNDFDCVPDAECVTAGPVRRCAPNVLCHDQSTDPSRTLTTGETDVDCGGIICADRCGPGKVCRLDGDCVAGLVCAPSTAKARQGTCVPPASRASGGACSAPGHCAANTYCDTGKGMCQSIRTEGDSCVRAVECGPTRTCQHRHCMPINGSTAARDGARNGDETDVDCGGAVAGRCAGGLACAANGDCASGVCSTAGRCVPGTGEKCSSDTACATPSVCTSGRCAPRRGGVVDGAETDLDCGGDALQACAVGRKCRRGSDCVAGSTCGVNGRCVDSCSDGARGSGEVGIDCGGKCTRSCEPGVQVVAATAAAAAVACRTRAVTVVDDGRFVCAAPSCTDGVGNGDESDVDCGGSCAAGRPCVAGASCRSAADCASGLCTNSKCSERKSNIKDADESDVDCGGGVGARCGAGRTCRASADCDAAAGLICLAGRCKTPQPSAPCGFGLAGGPCPAGRSCRRSDDCASGLCRVAVCTAASDVDGVRNGTESDVDCGGSASVRCVVGQRCTVQADCAGGGSSTICRPDVGRCTAISRTCATTQCGADCPSRCADGMDCRRHADCASGRCLPPAIGRASVCVSAEIPSPCRPGDTNRPECVTRSPSVREGLLDYGFWYWPSNHRPNEGWPRVERRMHFVTGRYGMSFDEQTGDLVALGAWADSVGDADARLRTTQEVDALPGASIRFGAGAGAVATDFKGFGGDLVHRARLVDSGSVMNRIDVPTVSYAADSSLSGSIQLASMPRHVVFTQTVTAPTSPAEARITLGGAFLAGLSTTTWLSPDHALTLSDGTGRGWLFVVSDAPAGQTRLSLASDGAVVAERLSDTSSAVISLLVAPLDTLSPDDVALYVSPAASASVTYTLLSKTGAAVRSSVAVPWDASLGAFLVPLGTLQEAGAPARADFEQAQFHHWHGRHRIVVDPHGRSGLSVPLAFHGNQRISWYITGGVPLLRDAAGEPTGLPVQVSKNWHGDYWYHLYSQPTLESGDPTALELTMASSKWGDAYAASHAQLCLIGWAAAAGRWDESALGAFGESVTYDPDVVLQRAMMDDVRPLLVDAKGRWTWTGNVGGADFLRYSTATEPSVQRRLGRVRTITRSPGPVSTDVTYSGLSSDGRIRADIRTRLGASDDLVRVFFDLEYEFLSDVSYDRLAFFQVAADNYADNGFARYSYGDAVGVSFSGPADTSGPAGYRSDTDRGILLPGPMPWVLLSENQRIDTNLPEHHADVGFVVRSFQADLGSTRWTTPAIHVRRTTNSTTQMAFELGLPDAPEAAWCGAPCLGRRRFVPAGSRVRATIEYVVPPANKDRYYGQSPWLTALDAGVFGTPEMMRRIAAGGTVTATAHRGTVTRRYPVEVFAAPGQVAADVTLEGGLGRVVLVFRGLVRPDGWRLESRSGEQWIPIDQSTVGNDWWQAEQDPATGSYALAFTVPGLPRARYRLVWNPQ